MYINEREGLRSEPPGVRGVDGATPAHSNQYNTRSYDKHNCASAIVVRSFAVAFCCNVLNLSTMQINILSVSRLTNKETGESLNMFVVYTDNKDVPSLRMYKDGLKEVKGNSFKVFDSYLESCLYDAISTIKEGRVYTDLLNLAIDTDTIVNLLLTNATIDVSFEKVDSLCEENSIGYYYKYNIDAIKLNVDDYAKVSIFEMYRKIFADRSDAYLKFISKLLGVENVFYS